MSRPIEVVLEIGSKRTFASALRWPGWCRPGPGEETALEALLAYGPRYAGVLSSDIRSTVPRSLTAFEIVERIPGDATTDFGAPGTPASADAERVTARELDRLTSILRACWRASDAAVGSATGARLRPGPRGGGRDVAKIASHVLEADLAYLMKLGGKAPSEASHDEVRGIFVEALGARARGELPDVGPRGGARWSARYAVRRSAWHALDHAWEIEDRLEPA